MTVSRLALYGISLLHYESRLRKALTGTGLQNWTSLQEEIRLRVPSRTPFTRF